MPKEYSPFTPGQPVPVEFFVGRVPEINRLKTAIEEASTGRLRVAFLSGERGIGKSSVASFVRFLGERDLQVLGLHTFLGGVTTLEEMVRRVFDRLLNESVGRSWHEKVKEFFGNHIRQVGLFGVTVQFTASEADLKRMVNDFVPAVRRLVQQLGDEKRAVFVILDDINGLADSELFANWLKSLVDEIATSGQPLPICIVLVGLEERRQSLIKCQPSLARVFSLIELRPWNDEETHNFFQNAFDKVGIQVERAALSMLVQYAGGLPVLAHEIGDATFRLDEDSRIDVNDAVAGVAEAADIVGRKHLQPQVFQAIRSERYRAILRKVQRFGMQFRRSELREHLSGDEAKVLDNFLSRMKALGVVRTDPEHGPGTYRFDNELHRLYFEMEARRVVGKRGFHSVK